jgi:hypothetical protein
MTTEPAPRRSTQLRRLVDAEPDTIRRMLGLAAGAYVPPGGTTLVPDPPQPTPPAQTT